MEMRMAIPSYQVRKRRILLPSKKKSASSHDSEEADDLFVLSQERKRSHEGSSFLPNGDDALLLGIRYCISCEYPLAQHFC